MGSTKYITSMGELTRKDNSICFRKNQKNIYLPIENIKEIYCMNEISINTKLLDYISSKNIVIHFFNYYGFYTGTYYPKESLVSGKLLIKQVEHYTDPEKRIELAKTFIEAASYNIYRNLNYYNNRGKDVNEYMKEIEFFRNRNKFMQRCTRANGGRRQY